MGLRHTYNKSSQNEGKSQNQPQGRAVKLRWVMTNPPIKAPAFPRLPAEWVAVEASGADWAKLMTHLHSRHNGESAPQHDGQHGGDRVMDRHGEDGQNAGCRKVNTQNGGGFQSASLPPTILPTVTPIPNRIRIQVTLGSAKPVISISAARYK